ncbi:hypothetical protein M407DRAFT_27228 [Tulasnella calospora MUT 4182]|uniref:ATPase dynein-related AAA domain-containing protein n=1 Tax=Tulasnella calospora MUT 4182 TaxID=1051891 RepID=A0A0C3LPI4_9AGAM|nr:hypothetical protein M407DRAFT_27228 [Tulasnella calospora MUT 4182]
MAFTIMLDAKSADTLKPLAERWGEERFFAALLNTNASEGIVKRPNWPLLVAARSSPLHNADDHILTPSTQRNLIDLSRIILNTLVFHDRLLVCALREGHWIVLDELNLVPTDGLESLTDYYLTLIHDVHNHPAILLTGGKACRAPTEAQQEVITQYATQGSFHQRHVEFVLSNVCPDQPLEARQISNAIASARRRGREEISSLEGGDAIAVLQRLEELKDEDPCWRYRTQFSEDGLDDNQELVIPETQEIVLSRAFRKRFLDVHFTDVPQAELEVILAERCKILPSRTHRIVAIFEELQKRRQRGAALKPSKDSPPCMTSSDGYMLLAETARNADHKAVVKEVMETVLKVKVDDKAVYRIDARALSGSDWVGLDGNLTDLVFSRGRSGSGSGISEDPLLSVGC